MPGWASDLFFNILANIIFWLGLGLIFRYLIVSKTRKNFLKFFGLDTKKKLIVYLSNLWLPSITIKPWGRIISGYEFKVTKSINNLFGSTPSNVPDLVKGLVDALFIEKNLEICVEVSPLTGGFDLSRNMIVVGASIKNSIRRCLLNDNMAFVTISGEPLNDPINDNKVLDNPLKQSFEIKKGMQTGTILEKQGDYNIAVVEKVCEPQSNTVIFMCVGLRGDSTWIATEYLARHWDDLFKKYGDNSFARCLWFPNSGKPMEDYAEPVIIEDISF
jgi:hypothetical protein